MCGAPRREGVELHQHAHALRFGKRRGHRPPRRPGIFLGRWRRRRRMPVLISLTVPPLQPARRPGVLVGSAAPLLLWRRQLLLQRWRAPGLRLGLRLRLQLTRAGEALPHGQARGRPASHLRPVWLPRSGIMPFHWTFWSEP